MSTLRVPVEIRRQGEPERWFRLAISLSPAAVELSTAVPEELEGPLEIVFHLPGDRVPISVHARAAERVVDEGEATERSERRALEFIDLDEEKRTRLIQYLSGV